MKKRRMKWIPINQPLPKAQILELVFMTDGDFIFEGELYDGEISCDELDEEECSLSFVSHWIRQEDLLPEEK